MFLIIFQTFAFMQIFNILNARRPSYKDLNPFEGFHFLTNFTVFILVGVQFLICYIPSTLGYGSISIVTNVLCMGLGALSVIFFTLFKCACYLMMGGDSEYSTVI